MLETLEKERPTKKEPKSIYWLSGENQSSEVVLPSRVVDKLRLDYDVNTVDKLYGMVAMSFFIPTEKKTQKPRKKHWD